MLKIYGSPLCPDCVQCTADLEAANVEFEYLNITENLQYFKEFLKIRDGNELFDPVREKGQIGIPCIVCEDGTVTFDWEEWK